MKSEQIFKKWKEERSHVHVPAGFASRVMEAIKADGAGHSLPIPDQWMPSLLGRWSAALTLLLLGVFRIFFVLGHLIGAGSIAP